MHEMPADEGNVFNVASSIFPMKLEMSFSSKIKCVNRRLILLENGKCHFQVKFAVDCVRWIW